MARRHKPIQTVRHNSCCLEIALGDLVLIEAGLMKGEQVVHVDVPLASPHPNWQRKGPRGHQTDLRSSRQSPRWTSPIAGNGGNSNSRKYWRTSPAPSAQTIAP